MVRICRVSLDEDLFFGVIEGEAVILMNGHPFGGLEPLGRIVPLSDVRLIAPVLPSKVIAVGRNYAEHAREMGNEVPAEPMIFLKPSTSVIGPGEPITLPWQSERVDHEAELAVVIGRLCRDVPEDRVDEVVLGYTCANDVTARDLQKTDGQWGRAKGFDSFCPLGPWIETEFVPGTQRITTTLNGEIKQDAKLSDMIFKVEDIIHFVTQVMTLLPGDVIITGTPAGIGPMPEKSTIAISIEGLGQLTNKVSARP